MTNTELIEKFYSSFAKGNAEEMTDCYHENILFQDPVFGKLKGDRACAMWNMLMSGKTESIKISFNNVEANTENGSANWRAEYYFGKKNRKVINNVKANFKFNDGKILEHKDSFSFWKWTQQALGPAGYLIGWTPFMEKKIQRTTNKILDRYISRSS